MNSREKTALVAVFGCQMNKLDGELVRSLLAERGYSFTDSAGEAGLILFLTCSVRRHAEERVHSRLGALKALKKKDPNLIIGILGCMAQEHAAALFDRHPHLDIVCGTRDFHSIADLVERARSGERRISSVDTEERPHVRRNERLRPVPFRAFLSVMRGCNRYCSYCIVPFVRGREESRPAGEIVEEARRLIDDGVKEITLLGQVVNRYDDGAGNRLPDLLAKLDALPGLRRLNFVTSHPGYVDGALVAALSELKTLSRFLHVPAQSGSDRVLRRMNRGYTAARYRGMASGLVQAVPDMELGSDFIVGFPGETEEDFAATLDLMEKMRFKQSFVFRYSPRPGTVAALKYPDDVPREAKAERNAILLETQERISREKNERSVGRTVEVLVEGTSRRDASRYTGRTIYNDIVVFPGNDAMVGRFARVHVESCTALTLTGDSVVEVND